MRAILSQSGFGISALQDAPQRVGKEAQPPEAALRKGIHQNCIIFREPPNSYQLEWPNPRPSPLLIIFSRWCALHQSSMYEVPAIRLEACIGFFQQTQGPIAAIQDVPSGIQEVARLDWLEPKKYDVWMVSVAKSCESHLSLPVIFWRWLPPGLMRAMQSTDPPGPKEIWCFEANSCGNGFDATTVGCFDFFSGRPVVHNLQWKHKR